MTHLVCCVAVPLSQLAPDLVLCLSLVPDGPQVTEQELHAPHRPHGEHAEKKEARSKSTSPSYN